MKIVRRARWWLLGLAALLLVARALLPTAIQRYVNRKLDEIPEYDGRIGDVDVSLWRGAYQIQDVSLVKTTGKVPVPLFEARKVDLSVEWSQLWHGRFVGEIEFFEPEINFVSGPDKASGQAHVDASWIDTVKDLFPVKLNRVTVHDGQVHYRDFHSNPKVNVVLKEVEGVATQLTNQSTPGVALPAGLHVTGSPPGGGSFLLDGKLAPLEEDPTFTIDASFKNVPLAALNDFLKAYASVDAERGTFEAYAELAGAKGAFQGYVKPLFKDIKLNQHREGESVGRRVWEEVVQIAAKVLQNKDERVATRVPIKGDFDHPEPDTWAALGALLRNAFIQALVPGIEGTVGLPTTGPLKSSDVEKKAADRKKSGDEKKADDEKEAAKKKAAKKKADEEKHAFARRGLGEGKPTTAVAASADQFFKRNG